MPVEWDRPLRRRRGGRNRLGGLDIYHDFNWRDVFNHNRSIFPSGQSLAHLVRRECPNDKRPCLLLTERDDVVPSIQQTDEDYVVIVPIRHYLNNAGADAASSYYARLSGAPLTQLPNLADAIFTNAELQEFLAEQLNAECLADWVGDSAERHGMLRDLVAGDTLPVQADVAAAIRSLSVMDADVIAEIANYVTNVSDGEQLENLFARLMQVDLGREAVTEALAQRLPERIADIRGHLEAYETLIADEGASETDVQCLLEDCPWIVGLTYVRARPRLEIPRAELDFVLDRFDGFFDVIELKGPREPIIIERNAGGDRPPSASSYAISPALAAALAQAHHYRAILEQSGALREQYGLSDTRQPNILIVLGSSEGLSEPAREILRQLNLSLHRVEVIPYDLLGRRTAGLLNNLETLLG